MPKLRFHTMDVFTDRQFAGNPLAVVFDGDGLDTERMQTIAREFNLSETIFVLAALDPANTCAVRIFTPGAELPFAGHPTIVCAILLAALRHKEGCAFETTIRLEAPAGLIPVTVTRIGGAPFAKLTAPRIAAAEAVDATEADIAAALGLRTADIGLDGQRPMAMSAGNRFLAVPVASPEVLGRARVVEPHFAKTMAAARAMGAYPYTRGDSADWRVRLFAPGTGVPEDPATGSAAAALPAVLRASSHLPDDGTGRFSIEQGIEMGRPSRILVEADLVAGALTAVRIAGSAVRVSEGSLLLD